MWIPTSYDCSLPLPTFCLGIYGSSYTGIYGYLCSTLESTTAFVLPWNLRLPTLYIGVYRYLHPTLESTVAYDLQNGIPSYLRYAEYSLVFALQLLGKNGVYAYLR